MTDSPSVSPGGNPSPATRWVRLSAILLGLVVLFAASSPFMSNVIQRHNLTAWGIMPLGAMVVFLGLCAVNDVRGRQGRLPLTTPAESLACFLVLLMGSWAATWAFVEAQMPLLTAPYLFASPENGWIDYLLPHLPAWALGPGQEPYASGFYNGLPDGTPVPGGLWVVPVAAWTLFVVALALACAGLASLLSRQ